MNQSDEIIKLRTMAGMNRKEFSEYSGIPCELLENVENGKKRVSEYLLVLLNYKLQLDKKI